MTNPLAVHGPSMQRAALDTAVMIAEGIGVLPAVPTQNWCDLAGATLLPLGRWTYVAVFLGNVDQGGRVLRQDATGVAGGRAASVTTLVGRTVETQSMVAMDSNELALAGLRAAMAQGKELGWSPGVLSANEPRVGTPEELSGPNWRQQVVGRRWARAIGGTEPNMLSLWLGAVALAGSVPRTLVVEVGIRDRTVAPESPGLILEAVLKPLARRAFAAVGGGSSDSTLWLTTKEQVILNHLLAGESVREIADQVGRSMHTVHDHVKSLHRKLGAKTRGELISRALGHIQPTAEPAAGESADETSRA
ncbi:MAG: response regulator transcription factor [Phycisphaerales bacterium]